MITSNGKPTSVNRVSRRAELTMVDRPSRNGQVLWVEKLKGNDVQKFVVVSPRLIGFCTHYVEGRKPPSVPCWADHEFCEGGHSDENTRENFLLMSWSLRKNKMVFLYLTPGAARQLEDQVDPGEPLRGMPLVVERTSAANGRLNVRIGDFISQSKISKVEIDPWESIMVYLKVPKHIRDLRRELHDPLFPLDNRR